MQQQGSISQSDCGAQWQLVMTSSVAGPGRGSKALPKAKLAPQKGQGHCSVICCPSDPLRFLNSDKTIAFEKYAQQISEMHQKLQCLQPALANRMVPILHDNIWPHVSQPTFQKLNELSYEVLPHPPYSPDLSATDYHFLKHLDYFLQGKCFHNQQEAEVAFQEFVRSQSTDFYASGINKQFSLAKVFWLQWFLFWVIKMCLSLVIMF